MNLGLINNKHFKILLDGMKSVFFIKIFGMLISYYAIFLIASKYGPSIVGIYSVSMSFILILAMFSSMGINISILRFVGELKDSKSDLYFLYKYSIEVVILMSLLISIIFFKIIPILSNDFFQNSLYLTALQFSSFVIPFMAILNIGIEFLVGIGKFKKSEILRSVLASLIVVTIIVFYSFTFSSNLLPIYSLCFGIIICSLLSIYYVLRYLKNNIQSFSIKSSFISRKKIIKTSYPMMITSASALILANISLIMCEYYLSTEEVGIYSICWKISGLVSVAMLTLNSISGPKFSELFWTNKYIELQETISDSTRVIFYISCIIALFIMIFRNQIFLIFGNDFSYGAEILVYLVLGQMVYCSTSANGIFLNMIGKQKLNAFIVFMVLILNIILNIILIPKLGLRGAGISTLVSSLCLNVTTSYLIQKKYNFKTYFIPKTLNFNKD